MGQPASSFKVYDADQQDMVRKFRAIKRALEAKWLTYYEIAQEFGVNVRTVQEISVFLQGGRIGQLPTSTLVTAFGVKRVPT